MAVEQVGPADNGEAAQEADLFCPVVPIAELGGDVYMAGLAAQREAINAGRAEVSRRALSLALLEERGCWSDPVVAQRRGDTDLLRGLSAKLDKEHQPFPNPYRRPLSLPYAPEVRVALTGLIKDYKSTPGRLYITPGELLEAVLPSEAESQPTALPAAA